MRSNVANFGIVEMYKTFENGSLEWYRYLIWLDVIWDNHVLVYFNRHMILSEADSLRVKDNSTTTFHIKLFFILFEWIGSNKKLFENNLFLSHTK